MFEEPSQSPGEKKRNPLERARDKADESRMHAELAAIFEGPRKFDAALRPASADLAREIQRWMAKLAKARTGEDALLPADSAADAVAVLSIPSERGLATGDYHIYARPGEVMILRWLAGEEVETFYERLQAHFDAAMEGHREDERQAHEWQQDEPTITYLEALDAMQISMAERYRRDEMRTKNIFLLSTIAADELSITYLSDYIMGVPVTDIVGAASAPPDDPTEQDLSWFFKLFALRGAVNGVERMCFFAFLQKSDDSGW